MCVCKPNVSRSNGTNKNLFFGNTHENAREHTQQKQMALAWTLASNTRTTHFLVFPFIAHCTRALVNRVCVLFYTQISNTHGCMYIMLVKKKMTKAAAAAAAATDEANVCSV